MNLIRAWIGPLPAFICYLNLLLKGGIANGFLFLMLGIFVMKYLFICKWKRLRPIDDDFVARITVLCAVFWGFGLQFSKLIGPGRYPNNFVSIHGVSKSRKRSLIQHSRLFVLVHSVQLKMLQKNIFNQKLHLLTSLSSPVLYLGSRQNRTNTTPWKN